MGRFIDLTGQKFGRLTVLKKVQSVRYGNTSWKCLCECGNTTITTTGALRSGACKSCGCLHRETASLQGKSSGKHNLTNTRLYRIWTNMKTRCYNKNNKNYERWGARGIYVCDVWKDNFKNFYDWAMSSGYVDGLSIDRIDNSGPYCPENCRWATAGEQARNTRNNKKITYGGITMCEGEWADFLGIDRPTFCYRLKKYSLFVAFTAPVSLSGKELKKYVEKYDNIDN